MVLGLIFKRGAESAPPPTEKNSLDLIGLRTRPAKDILASGRLNIDRPIDTTIAAWPILAEKSFGHKTIFNTNTVESIYVK